MKLSEKVKRVLQGENISLEELDFMVRHAARSSLEGFNFRYFHWLFKIEENDLVDMRFAQTIEIGGKGKERQTEEHLDCMGEGCKGCGWAGEVIRMVSDKPLPTHTPLRLRPY